MEFHVMAQSYNYYGGHTTLSPMGDFLLMGAENFGDAIRELTVTLHFRDSGPPKKALELRMERHNSYRSTLPKITGLEAMDDEVRDEAAIGLAFADIKLRATCDQQARRLAVEAIERQRNKAEAATEWSHRNERLKTLEKIEAKLQQTDNNAFEHPTEAIKANK